jgi:hypothetical protein
VYIYRPRIQYSTLCIDCVHAYVSFQLQQTHLSEKYKYSIISGIRNWGEREEEAVIIVLKVNASGAMVDGYPHILYSPMLAHTQR